MQSDQITAHGRRRIGRLSDAHVHDHFGTLFALLLAAFVANGFAEFVWARVASGVLQIAMLVVAFYSTRGSRRVPIAAVAIVMVVAAIVIAIISAGDGKTEHGSSALLVAAAYGVLLVAVSRRVMQQRTVTLETLFGALCVYFLIGTMFTDIYLAVDAFSVEPVFGSPKPREDFSYFSFVTLTTLGYGDIVARTDIGRRFAVVEAMAGQVFLATVIARLVSLYGIEHQRTRDQTAPTQVDSGEGR